MKQILIVILILASLCGCTKSVQTTAETAEATTEAPAPAQLPQGLEGQWTSATVSDRGYSESITFNADGTLYVESLKNGKVETSIFGNFHIEGNQIIFEISDGATPYKDYFEYILDGRELYLIDDDGPAHYLRTS